MKIFKKKETKKLNMELEENRRDNEEYEEYIDKEKEEWLEGYEEWLKETKKTERRENMKEKAIEVAKSIGTGICFAFVCVGTLVASCALAAFCEETDTTKDWREDDDLFNDIDYSADSEDTHSQVQIALDMTNLDNEKDCVKTYLWMYKNLENMPKTVKTVIGMTKGQIDSDHLARPQTEVYAWYSREREVAQKAMKQLK